MKITEPLELTMAKVESADPECTKFNLNLLNESNCMDTISISSDENICRVNPESFSKISGFNLSETKQNGKKSQTKDWATPTLKNSLKKTMKISKKQSKSVKKNKVVKEVQDEELQTPKIKKRKIKNESTKNKIINSDDEKLSVTSSRRKLTKSTDLKKISFRDHPASQTKLEKFFVKTPKTNSIGYFETFEKSSQKYNSTTSSTIENFNSYLGGLIDELNIKIDRKTEMAAIVEGEIDLLQETDNIAIKNEPVEVIEIQIDEENNIPNLENLSKNENDVESKKIRRKIRKRLSFKGSDLMGEASRNNNTAKTDSDYSVESLSKHNTDATSVKQVKEFDGLTKGILSNEAIESNAQLLDVEPPKNEVNNVTNLVKPSHLNSDLGYKDTQMNSIESSKSYTISENAVIESNALLLDVANLVKPSHMNSDLGCQKIQINSYESSKSYTISESAVIESNARLLDEANLVKPSHLNSDLGSQETQMNSYDSSKSYTLSESAVIYTTSSFKDSSEATLEELADVQNDVKAHKGKRKIRKRLSFKGSSSIVVASSGNNATTTVSVDSNESLPILNTEDTPIKSKNRSNSSKKNVLFNISEVIELSDLEDEYETDNRLSKTSKKVSKIDRCDKKANTRSTRDVKTTAKKSTKRQNIVCPTYKVVNETTFAVDAFRFGDIEGVTHYFLTHFHGDHYIGLKKSFCKPIYMSSITARLVEKFVNVSPEYLHVIDPDQSVIINEVEVTAIDANHCPGAVMFAFKLPSGKIFLHTGDFRASHEMESNPYFWNNQIDTVYLDTTYLNKNYDFKSQSESIEDVKECVQAFREKHIGKKILYVCGSYVIGKEKVWAAVADETGELVYTTGTRLNALNCVDDPNLVKYLMSDPIEARIHVLAMGELYYDKLFEYWKLYEEHFDIVLALRPSGWERNAKPQYRGKINIVGIEYSEHSSCSELRRFIRFLQPKHIISTVPFGTDLSKTCPIPISWFDNRVQPKLKSYQPSITNFTSSNKKKKSTNNVGESEKELPYLKNVDESQCEIFVSPIKSSRASLCGSKMEFKIKEEHSESDTFL